MMALKVPDPESEDARTPVVKDPPPALVADDDEPGLSWDEYLERRRELEDKLVALKARFVASVHFPRMLYHASLAPRVVQSKAERQALGAGWQPTPVAVP